MKGGVALRLLEPRARPPAPRGRARTLQRSRSRMIRLAAPLACVTAGLLLCGQGITIHVKAAVAQVLLERAFAETIASGHHVKPWSWADTWPIARIEIKR